MDCVWSEKDSFCAILGCCFSSAGQQKTSPSSLPRPQKKEHSSLLPQMEGLCTPPGSTCLFQYKTSEPLLPTPTLVCRLWDNRPIHHLTSLTLFPDLQQAPPPPLRFLPEEAFWVQEERFPGRPSCNSPASLMWSRNLHRL